MPSFLFCLRFVDSHTFVWNIDFIAKYIAKLKPTFYIDRFAGEVPPRFVNETPWGLIRYQELRTMLEKRMEELNLTQGCNFTKR